MDHDLFISHASEDKEAVARPLAHHLRQQGLRVWLDECELQLGDSLRRKIDHALSHSHFGVVILSTSFFSKEWPQKELDGLFAREIGREKVILPIWHNVNASDVAKFSPMLADKVAVSTSRGMPSVVEAVVEAVRSATEAAQEPYSRPSNPESEPLERIRRSMLMSTSSRDLRRIVYELEAHLALYPHSVDGRELRDQLLVAIRRAERHESPRIEASPAPTPLRYRSPLALMRWLSLTIGVGVALAVLYFLNVI